MTPLLSPQDSELLGTAAEERDRAQAELRRAVIDVLARQAGSVREIAAATGLSTNTVSRWKRGD
jgi:transposase-like protein